ncbi:glutamate synthase small subunit [Alkalibaculum sp. M08DMB]|uniref:Glutamate synthase small subunit n=1 Tax=Alkalibaculum sporogenes TaxID=2655001 RepID=A0A6A7KBF2_9FIRM|nr:glutamate synthase subunit beta [Alkalibaculum sporogenes]MPW26692.1 glutamate synthase small subunit [Alkalibaculum sporogenes]
MGKYTGFLEYERVNPAKRPPEERINDWNELKIRQDNDELSKQGARCMDCGIPFCHGGVLLNGMAAGCPARNLIPEWNDLVYTGQWEDAYKRLIRTMPFPEFTGRVCPAPCEGSCTEGYILEAVAINNIEQEIIDRAFEEGWVKNNKPTKRTGKKIAVVGSGPSGLATAYYLNAVGHLVTVYERNDRIGGLLMYGIPNMKLDKKVVQRRVDLLSESGVQFITNTEVGIDISSEELVDKYDAVILCCGATKPRALTVIGADLMGVHNAVDFLKANTKSLLDSKLSDEKHISAKDKNIIVIGGGDTGTDCVATSIRHGCNTVYQFEIMPEPPSSRQGDNPWPEWPKKLKVDYGQEEAIHLYGSDPRNYNINTKKIVGNSKGEVTEVHTVNVVWEKDSNGRFGPQEVPGSEKVWKADIVLIAMGFLGPEDTIADELHLDRDGRSNIKADYEKFETNIDKVFVAGDCRRGQSLVVWAIQEGKLVAREVDKHLMGSTVLK